MRKPVVVTTEDVEEEWRPTPGSGLLRVNRRLAMASAIVIILTQRPCATNCKGGRTGSPPACASHPEWRYGRPDSEKTSAQMRETLGTST